MNTYFKVCSSKLFWLKEVLMHPRLSIDSVGETFCFDRSEYDYAYTTLWRGLLGLLFGDAKARLMQSPMPVGKL